MIDQVIFHESYEEITSDKIPDNDIALLRITSKETRNRLRGIIFGSRVRPLCLPSSEVKHKPKTKCTISGWGRINNNENSASNKHFQLTIIIQIFSNLLEMYPLCFFFSVSHVTSSSCPHHIR